MAKSKNTSIRAIGERESMLIGDDSRALPVPRAPKNIALVSALAQGACPRRWRWAEMADNVVPDLGVSRPTRVVVHAGRTVAFTNGMKANERTGALGNWTRMIQISTTSTASRRVDHHGREQPVRLRVARSEVSGRRFVV